MISLSSAWCIKLISWTISNFDLEERLQMLTTTFWSQSNRVANGNSAKRPDYRWLPSANMHMWYTIQLHPTPIVSDSSTSTQFKIVTAKTLNAQQPRYTLYHYTTEDLPEGIDYHNYQQSGMWILSLSLRALSNVSTHSQLFDFFNESQLRLSIDELDQILVHTAPTKGVWFSSLQCLPIYLAKEGKSLTMKKIGYQQLYNKMWATKPALHSNNPGSKQVLEW